MKVLVLDYSATVREGFISALIPAGFEVVAIRDKKELLSALAKKPFSVVVLEVKETDKEMLQLIRVLRSDNRFTQLKIILHIGNPSKQFIIDMIKLGVAGYMLKPFTESGLLQRFQNILKKAKIEIPQRRHVRVQPDESDTVTVTFRSPTTHKVITGNVVDVSAGGVAFTFFGTVTPDEVQVRQFINNFQLTVGKSRISTPALVVARKEKLCAVQYYKIQEYDLNIISKFIYEKLSKDFTDDK